MKLLTVTVPCYNSQDTMEKCIDSLLTDLDRVEVILIDDGSNDRTGEIADAYSAKYPDTVRVIHQENGGHGEGINQGLRHASGKYFKTVDSDDWLQDFPRFLETLAQVDKSGGVDLFVTNYCYEHADGKGNRSINFSNALPENRVFTWAETKPFRVDQILMIHACTYRTELLRQSGIVLPKHIFYEDNYLVYGNLKSVRRMYYMNLDLYCYFIGRAGQSVQEDVLERRYAQQLKASELCFTAYHLDDLEEKRKRSYCKHELFILLGIATVFARLNGSEQAEEDLTQMWANCRAFDAKWADYFRRRTLLYFVCLPGRGGRFFVRLMWQIAYHLVRFN